MGSRIAFGDWRSRLQIYIYMHTYMCMYIIFKNKYIYLNKHIHIYISINLQISKHKKTKRTYIYIHIFSVSLYTYIFCFNCHVYESKHKYIFFSVSAIKLDKTHYPPMKTPTWGCSSERSGDISDCFRGPASQFMGQNQQCCTHRNKLNCTLKYHPPVTDGVKTLF